MSNVEKAELCLLGHVVVQAASEECVCGLVEFAPSQGRQKHVLLCVESGAVLQELPSRASGSTKGGIIASLYNLHRSGRCFVQGAILCCSSGPSYRCRARLDLFIKQDAITGGLQWERCRSAGDLFSIMIPATDDTLQNSLYCPVCGNGSEQNCTAQSTKCFVCSMESESHERASSRQVTTSQRNDEDEQQWHISSDAIQHRVRDSLLAPASTENNSTVFKLHSCFEELPNWLVVASEYPPLPSSMPGQQSALQTLPQEAMHRIACLADDTSALACTCRYLRAICSEVASGLLPTLHPHQRAALKRMAERERVPHPVPHCHIRRLPLLPLSDLHVYVDCVTGDLSLQAPSKHIDIRGGLFCDDPGLGKTVTALALITNSLGKVPEPPKGSQERSGSFQDSFREVSGSFYMAPLSELLQEAGIDEAEGPNTALGDSSSTATAVSRGGSQPGEGETGTPKKRRASSRSRGSIVVMPNNRKARDAAQQGIKRPARNLKVLEDLKLAPNSASTWGEQTMKKQSSTNISGIASVGAGFTTEVEDFVGELPQNIRYFTDLILSFCHEYDVTPDALHSLPAVHVLLGRLQSQHRTFAPAAHAAITRGMGEHSFASQATHTEGALKREGQDDDAYDNDLAQASAAYVQCCASHTLRVPLVKYQLTQWAHTHLPTATQRSFTQNTGKGKPVSMNEAAAQAGTSYTQKLFSSLGLIPAEKAESQTHNSTKKRSLDGEDYDGDYIAPSPSQKLPKRASSQQKSAAEASLTPAEGSGAAESSKGSASLSYMFPEHVQSNKSLRFDAPALSRAFKEASIEHRRNADLEPVMLSPATLVVVPAILVEHWKHEIAKHVKHALLRVYCIEDAQSADIPAHELAWDYDVVLTTFTHLSAHGATWQLRSREARHVVMQVRWLRVILDEGHILGRSVQTNRMALLRALRAERRWVMTGTPTPQSGHKHVAALAPLLEFLHCAPFHGSSARLWEDAVCAPFEAGCVVGKQRLMDVLGRIMIRSSKAGVTESRLLPPCTKSVVRLPFDPQHQVSYNALVEIVLRNLLLADWFDEGHVESILNNKRSKFAAELLSNMRLACSVAGQCNLEPNIEDVLETLQILAKAHQMPVPEGSAMIDLHVPYQHPLSRVELSLRNGGLCDACNADTRMPLVTPCAHLLCVDCASLSSEACCVCGAKYEQQAVDAPDRRKTNPNPKSVVPQDLIELQPVFHQRGATGKSGGEWQPTWQTTRSTKCDYLLSRLRDLHIAPPLPAEEPAQLQNEAGVAADASDDGVQGGFGVSAAETDQMIQQGKEQASLEQDQQQIVEKGQRSDHERHQAGVAALPAAELPASTSDSKIDTAQNGTFPTAAQMENGASGTPPLHSSPINESTPYGGHSNSISNDPGKSPSLSAQHNQVQQPDRRQPAPSPTSLPSNASKNEHQNMKPPETYQVLTAALPPGTSAPGANTSNSSAQPNVQQRTIVPQSFDQRYPGAIKPASNAIKKLSCANNDSLHNPSRSSLPTENGMADDTAPCVRRRVQFLPGEVSGELRPREANAKPSKPSGTKRARTASTSATNRPNNSGAWSPDGKWLAPERSVSPDELQLGSEADDDDEHPKHASNGQSQPGSEAEATPSHKMPPAIGSEADDDDRRDGKHPDQSLEGHSQPDLVEAPHSYELPPAFLRSPSKPILKRTSSIYSSPDEHEHGNINHTPLSTLLPFDSDSIVPFNREGGALQAPESADNRVAESSQDGTAPADATRVQSKGQKRSRKSSSLKRGSRQLHARENHAAMSVLLPTKVRQAEEERQAAAVTAQGAGVGSNSGRRSSSGSATDVGARAIVFSAFWHHLLLVQQQLTFAGVAHAVLKGGMDRTERTRALTDFRTGVVRVLVMDSSGAVGLDLSFVQHVFLMEPLGDLSLEQQIISRAHRLGATHAVHAEVLVMKDSVEDDMVNVSNGKRTQKLSDAAEDSFITRCQREYWAKVKEGGEVTARPLRNLLLMSLKRVKASSEEAMEGQP